MQRNQINRLLREEYASPEPPDAEETIKHLRAALELAWDRNAELKRHLDLIERRAAEKFGSEIGYTVRFSEQSIKSLACTILIEMGKAA